MKSRSENYRNVFGVARMTFSIKCFEIDNLIPHLGSLEVRSVLKVAFPATYFKVSFYFCGFLQIIPYSKVICSFM